MATIDLTFTPRALAGPAPALGAGTAHIWRVDLDRSTGPRDDVLPPAEAQRASLMKHDGARAAFRGARTALRRILGAYTGVAAVDLPIVIDGRGKPELDLEGAPRFNISHSGATALVAVTHAGPIGVDLEWVRPTPRLDQVAARFFSGAEAAALRTMPDEARIDAFYACWTRKEAFVKAEGSGIANALSGFEVSVRPEQPARIVAIDGDASRADAWTLHAFRPRDNAWGAVCIAARDVEVVGFDLAPD